MELPEKDERLDHGLILHPILQGDHYVLGGYSGLAARPILMPDGHGWGAFKPTPEYQSKNGFESLNCSNYGTYNAYETLAKKKGFADFPKDCSERYSGVHTGTTHSGNDPHHVAEVIRTVCGAIPEIDMPFNDDIKTWDDYYAVNTAIWSLPFGKAILKRFVFAHEWVFNSVVWGAYKQDALINALKFGTVCVSVRAWRFRYQSQMYFKDDGDQDTHWLQLLDYVKGEKWIVYDSYDDVVKELEWHYNFFAAKVYYLDRNTAPQAPRTFWDMIVDMFVKAGLFGSWRAS